MSTDPKWMVNDCDAIDAVLATLRPRERFVLEMRFMTQGNGR